MPKLKSDHKAEIHANALTLNPGVNEVTAEQLAELRKDPAVKLYLQCGLVTLLDEPKEEAPPPPPDPQTQKGASSPKR